MVTLTEEILNGKLHFFVRRQSLNGWYFAFKKNDIWEKVFKNGLSRMSPKKFT